MLISENDAKKVFLVLNRNNEPCGTYPSYNRAMDYITNWVKTAYPDAVVFSIKSENGTFKVFDDTSGETKHTYTIIPTHYRD